MDLGRKLLILLILAFSISTTMSTRSKNKADRDNEEDEDTSSRRWDDDILDEDDKKPWKQPRINLRRAGKKPRIRIRGNPFAFLPKISGSSQFSYSTNMGKQFDPLFTPYGYMALHSGALKGLGSITSAKGLVPYLTSPSHQPALFATQPSYLSGATNQRLLKQLMDASLADDGFKFSNPYDLTNFKTSSSAQEILLANLLKNMGGKENLLKEEFPQKLSPSYQHSLFDQDNLKDDGHYKSKHFPSSSLSSLLSSSPHSSSSLSSLLSSSPHSSSSISSLLSSSPHSSSSVSSRPPPHYPYPNYPSPFTYQELPEYSHSHSHSHSHSDPYESSSHSFSPYDSSSFSHNSHDSSSFSFNPHDAHSRSKSPYSPYEYSDSHRYDHNYPQYHSYSPSERQVESQYSQSPYKMENRHQMANFKS